MEANRLNKLTQQARRESYSLNHDYIGSEHLLLALMKTDSVATKALEAAGANYDLLRQVVINNIGKGQAMRPATEYSKKVRQILELARLNANKFGNSSAGEEDVLFAILADDDSLTNIMFLLSGVEKEVVKRNLKELLQDQNPEVASIKDLSENVSNYARDLNEEAESGKIDPVIGRDDEIERVIQILMRRTKNNPILIGEPGVGKTAISEGLAQRIVEGEVPRIIEDKTIL
ncbi:MAG: Clp protease N-terminal domain-containing protein, partial [Anaerococcus sp.]|nr:Clp protease N-terminal domain-containing protein [Anaerococcus sp.]